MCTSSGEAVGNGGWLMKKSFVLMLLTMVALVALIGLLIGTRVLPVRQEALNMPRIFAYRGWQSVGVWVHQGDVIEIRAKGRWMYTPNEYHGPEGHRHYRAPGFYPLPNVPGGALIGRIGEKGAPFYVGERLVWLAERDGLLYLRIDDDILSDNDGSVTLEVTVTSGEASE
jgi:hypothetical protein